MDKSLAIPEQYFEGSDILVAFSTETRSQIPRAVRRMIVLFDGSRTVEEVCRQSQISVSKGLAIVRKLTGEGILHRPSAEAASALERADTLLDLSPLPTELTERIDGFSPEEEAFFNSEVEATDEWEDARSLRDRIGLFVSDLILRCKGSPAFY
jgi:hypothetical protein